MGLNPRLRIVCEKCEGLGVFNIHAATADDLAVCPVCRGTGRDATAEARLAELAERLPAAIHMAAFDGMGKLARDLDELRNLLTAGQPGAEPATKEA